MSTIPKEIREKYDEFAYMSQKRINAMPVAEFSARKEEYAAIHDKYFGSCCLYLRRQKTEKEMQEIKREKQAKKERRVKFSEAVAEALEETLDETLLCESMSGYLDRFKYKLERKLE